MARWLPKLSLLVVTLGSLVLFSFPNLASAHSVARDGNISAFLHIAPKDEPVAGQVNNINFYYNDKDFKFTTAECLCKIKVSSDNKVLYNGDLLAIGTRVGEIKLRLPDNNTSYKMIVSGNPKTAAAFQPFNLSFELEVGQPAVPPVKTTSKQVIIIPVVGAIALAGSINYYRNMNKLIRIKK